MHIKLENIKKSFGITKNVMALNGVTLRLDEGEMVAVMGKSGSGKSTLLNVIAGLEHADSGSYQYRDKSVVELGMNEWAKFRYRRIGLVVQNFALIDSLNVFENVSLPLKYSHVPRNKHKSIVEGLLNDLDIASHKEKYPFELSGGECQRVAIARALVTDPELILADEPTGALDSETEDMIIEVFKKLNRSGKTIIVVTHDSKVANSCSRILCLKDGVVTGG